MDQARQTGMPVAAPAGDRVGVVDIGSNTVRLVVYDTPGRLPIPIFNEKVQCELGRGMAASGRLNPAGVSLARQTLARFVRLARAMGVVRLDLVATAAVREAGDGADFAAAIEREHGLPVTVLSGAEEAELGALGLLMGVPEADGVLGDYGGGSLDLVILERGRFAGHATLPIGHLRLPESAGGDIARARRLVTGHLAGVPGLDRAQGRTLYAIGGALRAIARIFINQTRYPLHIVDNYTIRADEARRLLDLIAGLGPESLSRIPGVQRSRVATLPYAALVFGGLMNAARPATVVFSGFSMREGQLLKALPEVVRRRDPLVTGAAALAERGGRFDAIGDEIFAWMTPLFPGESAADARLRLVACLLADIAWSEHPDYRGEHAFHRVLRMPLPGITHEERVRLALAVFIRYNGQPSSPLVEPVRALLDERLTQRVTVAGLALRLGHTLSGGAPGLLGRTRLALGDGRLRLELPADAEAYLGETVERRFRTLAAAMSLTPAIIRP